MRPRGPGRTDAAGKAKEDPEPHRLGTLLADLATRFRDTCRMAADPDASAFTLVTQTTSTRRRAVELVETFPVPATA